jgi:hypothetical protein
VHSLRQTYHGLRNHFGRTWWYSKVTRLNCKLVLVCLEIAVMLTQNRCTDCAGRTIGSEIILESPDGTPRWRGSCGISLWSVWRKCFYRCKIGVQFATNAPKAQKLFWTHPMVHLGDMAQLEACFSPFGHSANLDIRYVRGLCRTYHRLRNYFGRTRWNS